MAGNANSGPVMRVRRTREAIEAVRARATAALPRGLKVLEDIVNGEFTSSVETTVRDAEGNTKSVTTSVTRPSGKDRLAALELLTKLSGLKAILEGADGGESLPDGAGVAGGVDANALAPLLRALSDPATKRLLLSDPAIARTLKLLLAEEVPQVEPSYATPLTPTT